MFTKTLIICVLVFFMKSKITFHYPFFWTRITVVFECVTNLIYLQYWSPINLTWNVFILFIISFVLRFRRKDWLRNFWRRVNYFSNCPGQTNAQWIRFYSRTMGFFIITLFCDVRLRKLDIRLHYFVASMTRELWNL